MSNTYLGALNDDADGARAKHEELQLLKAFKGPTDEQIEAMNQLWDRFVIQAKSPWISVNDRLPPTERTLAYSEYSGPVIAYWQPTDLIWTSEMFPNTTEHFIYRDITHWMPLPEPPNGKEER